MFLKSDTSTLDFFLGGGQVLCIKKAICSGIWGVFNLLHIQKSCFVLIFFVPLPQLYNCVT